LGKKGAALRAAKKQSASYTFTGEQLKAHDKAVIDAYKIDLEARMRETADQYVREYYTKIGAEFNSGDDDTDTQTVVSYLLAISVRVLVERFGWKPVRYNCRPTKLQKFAEYVIEEINAIRRDDTKDIRDYAKEVEDLYGVRFSMKEE
jgi:hypothetical protein